jgi:hypothetical protein
MSHYIYDAYYIGDPLENISNSLINVSTNLTNSTNDDSVNNTNQPNTELSTNSNPLPINLTINLQRFLNENFWRVYSKFQSKFLKEYPDTPCVYCGRLLYKSKASWIVYDPSQSYPIE